MQFHCKFYNGFRGYLMPSESIVGYTCEVEKITNEGSWGIENVLFTGKHVPGNTNDAVKNFVIRDQELEGNFPQNLRDFFPNLTLINIAGCGFKEISKQDFDGFENLEYLDLQKNNLTSLPNDLFENMKSLRIIRFNDNQIERLSSKLIEPIEKSLQLANFEGNTKIDVCFDITGVMNNLKLLKVVMDSLARQPQESEPKSEEKQEIIVEPKVQSSDIRGYLDANKLLKKLEKITKK